MGCVHTCPIQRIEALYLSQTFYSELHLSPIILKFVTLNGKRLLTLLACSCDLFVHSMILSQLNHFLDLPMNSKDDILILNSMLKFHHCCLLEHYTTCDELVKVLHV